MRAVSVCCVALLAWLLGSSVGSPVAADELMLSSDGVEWHTDLAGGMFGGAGAWVPGEARTGSLFVRNTTRTDARLSVRVTGPEPSRLVHRLVLRAKVGSGPWSAPHRLPVSDWSEVGLVAARADEVVAVRLRLDARASNATRSRSSDLGLTFRLDQMPPATEPSGVITTTVPDTGAPVLAPWAALGGLLIGGGIWLLLGRRGKRTGDAA